MAIKPTAAAADKNGNWKLSTVATVPQDASGNTDADVTAGSTCVPDRWWPRHTTAVAEDK
jgi:hypothetical protein